MQRLNNYIDPLHRGEYSIAFEYKLKFAKAIMSGGNAVFNIESQFIPVETLQIVKTTDYGTINGNPLGLKNLVKVFDLYENIPLLSQGIYHIDMVDFILDAGVFIPEPSVSSTIDLSVNDYFLIYLQKN